MNLQENTQRIKQMMGLLKEEEEHYGLWFHGGTGIDRGGNFLYVTDQLDEGIYYARLKGGDVYKLKSEFDYLVSWALGQSEGMINKEELKNSGEFDNAFELFIKLRDD